MYLKRNSPNASLQDERDPRFIRSPRTLSELRLAVFPIVLQVLTAWRHLQPLGKAFPHIYPRKIIKNSLKIRVSVQKTKKSTKAWDKWIRKNNPIQAWDQFALSENLGELPERWASFFRPSFPKSVLSCTRSEREREQNYTRPKQISHQRAAITIALKDKPKRMLQNLCNTTGLDAKAW